MGTIWRQPWNKLQNPDADIQNNTVKEQQSDNGNDNTPAEVAALNNSGFMDILEFYGVVKEKSRYKDQAWSNCF